MMQNTHTDSAFLNACRSTPASRIPVWFMRQAGRSLPGYRELRKTYDVLTLARTPELAARVSLEPVERLGVDAAILFADIMLLPLALGVDLHIVDSIGPIISSPVSTLEDLRLLAPFDPSQVEYLTQTVQILRTELKVPLIGFSGAPFTLASYLIEGKPTRVWTKTKRLMLEHTEVWQHLMEILTEAVIQYLSVQINAGVQAIQLFDSWVGCLSPSEYRRYVLPYVQRIFSQLTDAGVPRIHFGTDTGAMLKDFADVDCEVIGLDWRIDIADAKKILPGKALQGNLDPVILLSDERAIEAGADEIIAGMGPDPTQGFIFNLGHGILPETDDAKVRHLVEYIHGK